MIEILHSMNIDKSEINNDRLSTTWFTTETQLYNEYFIRSNPVLASKP